LLKRVPTAITRAVESVHKTFDSDSFIKSQYILIMVKGKAIPLQVYAGLEGSRRSRLPDF
jgi:hypothetical protein